MSNEQMQNLALPSTAPGATGFPQFRRRKYRSIPRFSVVSAAAPTRSSRSAQRGGDGKNRMFVFGMGFVGRYVGDRMMTEDGWEVYGTCTTPVKKKELEGMGFNALLFEANENRLEDLSSLQHATHLLVSIPPLAGIGDALLSSVEDLQNALGGGNLKWLCYLSTTSVYGDCGGALVTEDCPANPLNNSAKARVIAERDWLNLGHHLGVSTNVFRLGGIYGTGRSAIDTMLKGKLPSTYQRMRETRRFTARVHVADIYEAIKASFVVPTHGRIYNIVDDNPAPRAEVFAYAQDLIEEKWPGRIQRNSTRDTVPQHPMTKDDVKGEKRVSNARLKEELGVSFVYPDYRSGLRSILDLYGDAQLTSH